MTDRKKTLLLGVINAAMFVVLILFHYNGVYTIKLGQANPLVVLSLLVAISMFSSELTSALTGFAVGIFMDSVASTPQGFHAILFFIIGLGVSLTVRHLFNNNIMSSIALCVISGTIYYISRWIIDLAFSLLFTESLSYFIRFALPSVLYTTVFIVPLYYLERYLFNKLS